MASLIHACNLHWVLVVAFIDCLWLAMAVQVVLASNRIQRFFRRRNNFACRHYQIVFWCVFVQASAPIYLLERRNTSTAAMLVSLGVFIVTDWDLTHQRVVVAMICSGRWCFICDLIALFIFLITVFKRSNFWLLRFSHLNDIIFLELLRLIFIDGLCWFSTNIREHATLFVVVFGANGRYLLVDLCVGSSLNLTLCGAACSLLRCSLSLDTQGLVLKVSGLLLIDKDLADFLLLRIRLLWWWTPCRVSCHSFGRWLEAPLAGALC